MIEKELTITNEEGLHARPAAQFVKASSAFQSEIWVEKGDERVNGKSIMGLMMLAAAKGSKLLLCADGEDEEQAISTLEQLVMNGFAPAE